MVQVYISGELVRGYLHPRSLAFRHKSNFKGHFPSRAMDEEMDLVILEDLPKNTTFFCQGCCNKLPQTEWLKQQEFIVSLFGRLEVQSQDVGRVWFLLRTVKEESVLGLGL